MQEVFENIIEKLEDLEIHFDNDYFSSNREGMIVKNDAIEIVKQEAEKFGHDTNVGNNGWIPLSERLPENVDFVLFSNKDGEVETCTTEYFYDYRDEMIAWQPLPEPYQPKGEMNG